MTQRPGLEAPTVAQFIWQTLTSDATLLGLLGLPEDADDAALAERFAGGTLPFGGTLPGVRWMVLPPRDVKVVGMVQVFSTVQFDVIVTTDGSSYGPAVPVYERVHQLLEGRLNADTPLGQVLTCSRVSGIIYPERDNGVEYRHLGGTYTTEAL
jgi:hypothetical protein